MRDLLLGRLDQAAFHSHLFLPLLSLQPASFLASPSSLPFHQLCFEDPYHLRDPLIFPHHCFQPCQAPLPGLCSQAAWLPLGPATRTLSPNAGTSPSACSSSILLHLLLSILHLTPSITGVSDPCSQQPCSRRTPFFLAGYWPVHCASAGSNFPPSCIAPAL